MLTPAQRLDRFVFLTTQVRFNDWTFEVGLDGAQPWLRVGDRNGTCNVTGNDYSWWGRKWRLSFHMTDSEFVLTCFKAVMTALEHEAREQFRYRDRAILGPHLDVEKLWDLCGEPDCEDTRT